MTNPYRPGHFEPSAAQDLDERRHGLRGHVSDLHVPFDPDCAYAGPDADVLAWCPTCRGDAA